jgi:N-acetylmuramoyl-L-alanine amidase
MLTIAWYLLKVTICSGVLLGYYWLALRNKVFHHYNRFYLLLTIVLSVLLPFITINFWQNNALQSNAIKVIEAVSYGNTYVNDLFINATPIKKSVNWQILYPTIYFLISILLSIGFIKMLFQIQALLKKYPAQKIDKVTLVNTNNEKGTPFSFLQFIFWNSAIDISTTQGNQIFKHELAHIKEKHTYDKLFINIVLIIFWFNPFFWLLRKEQNLIHEFIADKKAVEDGDTSGFAAMLLHTIYPQHQFSIANNFFYSPIKRRLLMLTKNKNPSVNYMGRILVLPLSVLILAAFTFKVNKSTNHLYNGEKITVVIDAGHGGRDAGAKSADNIVEKDIALSISKKIKVLNSNNTIEIILTREEDIFVSPTEKAAFAKENGADIFISVHMAATPQATEKSGISFYVAKNEFANAGKSKVLAAALIDVFGKNYALPVNPAPVQREAGVWVLQANDIPSVLIEAGYITNESDARYLQTDAAKETIAKNILAAINKFSIANMQAATANNILDTTNFKDGLYINSKHGDINYLKDNNPDDITDAKGKTALINVSLKADDLPGVVVPATIKIPLYIINGKESTKADFDKLPKERITDSREIKESIALQVYGAKGKNGAIIINCKPEAIGPYANKMVGIGDISKIGTKPYLEVDGKEYPGNSIPLFMKETGIEHFELITLYAKEDAIKKFGNKASDGAIIATTKKIQHNEDHKVVIALDKMNMLYIGVDNPVSVAVSGYKTEDLIVSMQNGTITGKDGKYIARVSNINPAYIIIETIENGKRKLLGKQTYKVKRVPDPVDRITYTDFDYTIKPILGIDGSNKVRLKAAIFLNAKKITAGTGYEVVEASVYFSGAGFPKIKHFTLNSNELSKLKEHLENCVAGSAITFDNVRVKGDNGYYATIDGLSIQLY